MEFKHKKYFGQNFLTDINLLCAIVADAQIASSDNVLEIGVGKAALTKQLQKKAKKVLGYEIDKELKEPIEKQLIEFDNVEIVYKDFMKESNDIISEKLGKNIKVVANLPYYITTPIIFKLLESDLSIKSITIMVQKEVGERIIAKNGCKKYGVLSVKLQAYCDIKICRTVSRKMFVPIPNVDSCIVHMEIKKDKYNIIDYKLFDKVVDSAFNNRRKIFISNLKSDFPFLTKEEISNCFEKFNLDLKCRGETLTVMQFVSLTNYIYDIMPK